MQFVAVRTAKTALRLGLTTFLATTLTDVLNSPGVFDPAQLSVRKGEVTWAPWAVGLWAQFLGFRG